MCNVQARRIPTPPRNFSGDNFGGLQGISSPIAVLLKYATCWVNSCAIVCRSLFDRPLMTTCMLYNTVDNNAAGGTPLVHRTLPRPHVGLYVLSTFAVNIRRHAAI